MVDLHLDCHSHNFVQLSNGLKSFIQLSRSDVVPITNQAVDREEICASQELCIYQIIITFQSQSFEFVRINIEILDMNDHNPTFLHDVIWVDISETTAIGSTVVSLFAFDPDVGNNTVQMYDLFKTYLSSFGLTTYFSIVQEVIVAEIVVLKTLKIFQQNTYYGEIYENSADEVELISLHDEDLDAEQNGSVVYSLTHRTPSHSRKLFGVDSVNGNIKTLQSLDYKTDQHFLFVLQATSPSPFIPEYATVIIDVIDVNDNFPYIKLSSTSSPAADARISEAVLQGYTVAFVTISDKDSGMNGKMMLQLMGSNDDFVLE
uniref:Protocadherin-19-like n=1 Tax=Saccoglossus kowalevskii TaxID=10224 RepID=A0ABM0M4G7_SACKO|nr:PREDICTED: protocadherin-19-like [Saccoglossus kowalevskii]